VNFLGNLRSDGSLQVLVFLCLPLSLLLIVFIFWSVRNSKRIAKFPTFTVTIEGAGLERSFVAYREGDRNLQFDSVIEGGSRLFTMRIRVWMPKNFSKEDFATVVPRLSQGLEELPYEYSIYQSDGIEIPKGEYAIKV